MNKNIRDKKIVNLYLKSGSYAQIGIVVGISRERVRQILIENLGREKMPRSYTGFKAKPRYIKCTDCKKIKPSSYSPCCRKCYFLRHKLTEEEVIKRRNFRIRNRYQNNPKVRERQAEASRKWFQKRYHNDPQYRKKLKEYQRKYYKKNKLKKLL